ncbi:hypothetical protein CIT26_14940 [Mesorhizobium temperatum]|uniref:Uncharacterized protein n=1 Tax=Mesorhizobium temperatum TaxID=241416 RepID=A0A271LLB6_9HYPH|nr:hypothetical protein CIT26_14940 [Mesorhizobium temperatum]
MVAHLPLAQKQDARSPFAIADGVQLGVQPAFGATDTAGNIPFLKRLAAVRWAFQMDGIDHDALWLRPFAARAAKMRSNTPIWLQRR